MATANIYVNYKPDVMDPQGVTVKQALESLGYEGVGKVSVGRYFIIEIEGESKDEIAKKVDKMSFELLSNPVIENYKYELEVD